ncbi:arylsulfatase [Chitinophaga pendula]|uniref:arylsulfatase n=1 Tax=Chitinophaga TaxID=79328 RepID=UPI000BAFE7BF|nr:MULTISPECIES: arylsulfatase [Chitinophaga]ASZ14103.1 sulfatase [Chitinophaga sp. MD30]UCJ08265.1 arylsulfatase [Chitinophaga pendula]
MQRIFFLLSALISLLPDHPLSAQTKKPNIILIMVDDMGYADLGAYGSEIQTPHLDRLAKEGLRLKEFYNNAICAPTRASLLTGQYPHKAGIGYFDVNLGLPAYQGYLNKSSLTLAEVLKTAGYNTLMSGKWHVGNDSLSWPNQRGFEKYYGVIGGGADYFDAQPMPLGGRQYPVIIEENNKRLHPADNSYYFTDEIAGHAIQYLDEQSASSKPFFLYLAFNAPHWPLQALPEDIAKYKGRYDIGWDSLRQERLARQRQLGLLPAAQTIAPRDSEVPAWSSLTYDEKQLWKSKMEVYAAMVDRMDQAVGKVLDKLKALGKADNTLIVFISDNGAPAEDVAHWGPKAARNSGPVGTAGSFESQGKQWSFVSNSPFRAFKSVMYEGGISSPLIAWFPGHIPPGTIAQGTAHLIDLAPTFYEVAGARYPSKYSGTAITPLPGKSLTGLFFHQQPLQREQPIFWERAGNRAVRKGKWKLVSTYPQYRWELYDLDTDRGETNDLAAKNTQLVNELSAAYFDWADRTGVVDYDSIKPPSLFGK